MSNEPDMMQEALNYASRGFAVFPLYAAQAYGCSCRLGRNCTNPGKHPLPKRGLKQATKEPEKIKAFWKRWPEANIGICTGLLSGIIAIDLDNDHGVLGVENWNALLALHGDSIHTLTSKTGRGFHLLFNHPQESIRNSRGKLADGIDVRGEGGYIVAPPSLHAAGFRYAWQDPTAAIAEMPAWLIALLEEPVQDRASNSEALSLVEHQQVIPEGKRNNTLTAIGGRMRSQGLEEPEINRGLQGINATQCSPPLDPQEVRRVARSVSRYDPGRSLAQPQNHSLYWFPFYHEEWQCNVQVQLMNDYQVGWYWRLLVASWRWHGHLPDDLDVLWKLAHAPSRAAFELEADVVLAEFEPVVLNGQAVLRHPRMAEIYVVQSGRYRQTCEAGVMGVAERKRKSLMKKQDAGEQSDGEPQE